MSFRALAMKKKVKMKYERGARYAQSFCFKSMEFLPRFPRLQVSQRKRCEAFFDDTCADALWVLEGRPQLPRGSSSRKLPYNLLSNLGLPPLP